MKALWEKLRDAKDSEMREIAESMARYVLTIEETRKEAEEIVNALEKSNIDYEKLSDVQVSLSKYGKAIYFSGVKDKATFDEMLIVLADRYTEGKKEAYGNDVRYCFEKDPKKWDSLTVYLTVSTKVTGCKLIKEKILVPEKIVPEHEEEQITVKCD